MKQNKSTNNLHYIKIDNSKKNEIVLNITKYNITNTSKEKIKKHPKKISNIYYNNNAKHNRNKTLDLKLNNNSHNNTKTAVNQKKQQKIYTETTMNNNNKMETLNKNLYNNKMLKNTRNKEVNDIMFTILNKLSKSFMLTSILLIILGLLCILAIILIKKFYHPVVRQDIERELEEEVYQSFLEKQQKQYFNNNIR
jgi:preprotein translocase subunit SecF